MASAALEDYYEATDDLPARFCDTLSRIKELDTHVDWNIGVGVERRRAIFQHPTMSQDEKQVQLAQVSDYFDKALELQQRKCSLIDTLRQVLAQCDRRLSDGILSLRHELDADYPSPVGELDEHAAELNQFVEEASQRCRLPLSIVSYFPETPPPDPDPIDTRSTSSFIEFYSGERSQSDDMEMQEEVDLSTDDMEWLPTSETMIGDSSATSSIAAASSLARKSASQQNDLEQLYCLCRRPSSGFMIGCDQCDDWFHGECLRLTARDLDTQRVFYCPRCRSSQPCNNRSETDESATSQRQQQQQVGGQSSSTHHHRKPSKKKKKHKSPSSHGHSSNSKRKRKR